MLRAEIAKLFGNTAPGKLTTTLSPASKFEAPQTIPRTSSPPSAAFLPFGATLTWHQRIVLPFDCGSSTNSRTSPTTIGPERSKLWTPSSSSPTFTKASMTDSAVESLGKETYSAIQLSGALIRAPCQTALKNVYRLQPCRACR